jgi:hypothetical protein
MRIKVYLFSEDAKARAQSFSVFVLSIFTNGSKGSHICANIWHLIGRLNQTAADGVFPLSAFKPNSNNTASSIGTIAGWGLKCS